MATVEWEWLTVMGEAGAPLFFLGCTAVVTAALVVIVLSARTAASLRPGRQAKIWHSHSPPQTQCLALAPCGTSAQVALLGAQQWQSGGLPLAVPSVRQHTCVGLPSRRQVLQWLLMGGTPEMMAQTATQAVLYLLDHMSRSLDSLTRRRAGLLICPYEALPRVLASQRANRTLCARGGAPPFTVREPEHWPSLRDCIDKVDWAGGLLLRPNGAVYAVLEQCAHSCGACPWQSIASSNPGVISLACEIDSVASLALFHRQRLLRMPLPLVAPPSEGRLPAAAAAPLPLPASASAAASPSQPVPLGEPPPLRRGTSLRQPEAQGLREAFQASGQRQQAGLALALTQPGQLGSSPLPPLHRRTGSGSSSSSNAGLGTRAYQAPQPQPLLKLQRPPALV